MELTVAKKRGKFMPLINHLFFLMCEENFDIAYLSSLLLLPQCHDAMSQDILFLYIFGLLCTFNYLMRCFV